jgi:hypothetical protein
MRSTLAGAGPQGRFVSGSTLSARRTSLGVRRAIFPFRPETGWRGQSLLPHALSPNRPWRFARPFLPLNAVLDPGSPEAK